MYHANLIKEKIEHNINSPKLYEGIPSLSFKEGRIQSLDEQRYQHNYKPVIEGHNLLKHNIRKHRS